MKKRCFKTVGDKGRVYLPRFLCEEADIGKYDVVQVTEKNGVILLNKAVVTADDPMAMLRENAAQEERNA